jgi:hypothetical protein
MAAGCGWRLNERPIQQMSDTLARVQALAGQRVVRVSAHAYDELHNDDIRLRDVLLSLADAQIVEDYPDYALGLLRGRIFGRKTGFHFS